MTQRIEIIAPASGAVNKKEIIEILARLEKFGFSVSVPEDLISNEEPFFSNNNLYRANHLVSALKDKSIDIIWCLRGGSGSSCLINELDKHQFHQEKIIIGYSDITYLHLYFYKKYGWKTMHGAVLFEMLNKEKDEQNILRIVDVLNNKKINNTIELKPANQHATGVKEPITAPVIGGNLCVLQTSLATEIQINPKEKILFLEEVDECAYALARALEHFKQANIFHQCKAVVLGSFIGRLDKKGNDHTSYVLQKFAQELPLPIFQTDKIGHGKYNSPILLGKTYRIENHSLFLD